MKRTLCVMVVVSFAAVGAVNADGSADRHHIQAKTAEGATITVLNVPGELDTTNTTFTQQHLDLFETAASTAGWTPDEVSNWISALAGCTTTYGTLFVEENPEDPKFPEYLCTGDPKDCQDEDCVYSGGSASLTLDIQKE